jgi:RNA polymerase sigma factor (sigma-70 family)
MAAEARDVQRRLDAVWRIEAGKITGALARTLRDVGLAEEMAQDALVSALETWPRDGVPTNPGAWLMAAAKNKALDRLRQIKLHTSKQEELGADADARGDHVVPDFVDALDAAREDEIGDDLLRLIFTACHPVCPHEQRAALTLKLLGGLSTAEIARAYMLPEPTVAQRIVRAKKTLTNAKVPFEVPRGDALAERLPSVLEIVYLIFNEGYTATAGSDWMRKPLCDEALRLARMLQGLFANREDRSTGAREVHGLAALLEIQASRLASRVNAEGEPILLLDQDRNLWDRLYIGRGLQALARAAALPGTAGPYELQAAIAACHARAVRAEDTDWAQIVAIYDQLLSLMPSPVVRLNRAVALGMARGPAAALPEVEALLQEPALARYHLLHAVHGDLLYKVQRMAEARAAFEQAAAMTANERERALMLQRARSTLS